MTPRQTPKNRFFYGLTRSRGGAGVGGAVFYSHERIRTHTGQVLDARSLISFNWNSLNLPGTISSSVRWVDDDIGTS